MSIQYSENVFSGNMPFPEAHKKFIECIETGVPVMALHVGREEELDRRKKKADLAAEVELLKQRLSALEPNPKSDILHFPTPEEVLSIGGNLNARK